MATGFMTAIAKRSRTVEDFWCKSCTEQNLQESANIYCETCVQFYCKKCAIHHSEMSSKHTTHGRGDIKKWPVSTKVVDFLRKCELHDDKTLQQFCDDHSQLCCSDCFLSLHSQCNKVTPISELTSTMSTDLQGLSTKLETILEEIESLQKCQEAAMQSLDTSFTENEGFVMQDLSLNINTSIGARDDSTEKDLKEMKDEVISIKCSISSYIHKCIGLQNELSQLYESIQKIGDNKELCLIASIKCELALHHSFTVLGKSGKMFTVQGKTVHNVRIPNDSLKCYIVDCCVLSDGQVLLADQDNKKVKLLNQQYQVVSHCRVTQKPQGICQITPSEGAVAVNNEVQFITVNQGQLFLGRKLQLRHICTGIAHHQGDLFICSHNTLFKYSLSGKKICRLYEDISEGITVRSCAVSPTGDKLYITNWSHDKLLTLARDGTVLAIYTDPELIQPRGVHVTPAGQVLVCGWASNTIIQVECEGTRKLATLVTRDRDGVKSPMSVCYSSTTSSILVGQFKDENIMVFKVEPNKETSSKHVSTQGDFRRLFDQLNIDVMAECGSALFPAFRHGCGALQGIVTRGKCIFDDPVFNETESEIVFQRCIQLYTTSILMDNIKASYTKPMQLSHVKIFSRQKQNISFPALVAVDKERYVKIKNWISSLNKEINGLCVLLVNEATDTTYIAPEWGVFQSMTTISDTFVTADDLLERAIFAVLKNLVEKCINKYGSSTDLSGELADKPLLLKYRY
ncbi:uncharacterized protein LOC127838862 isoform X2 [Dreissena polymorpha]|uniref:uncharacterized protein LOC127838862 isoform X2 n=1 Tax=Dreissena polymorpha TaxID=45954 RepID=UPI0022655CC0|nr:uncharacterized protein LOC127838862 isoform X2 [Dreissena polymorpha]